MKITLKALRKLDACEEDIKRRQDQQIEPIEYDELISLLPSENKFYWADWLLTRILDDESKIKYATHTAGLILHVFEEKCPDDDRPHIEAAKNHLVAIASGAEEGSFAAAAAAAYAATDVKASTNIEKTIIDYGISLVAEDKNNGQR